MLRLFGAGITLLSCSAAGIFACMEMKKRVRTLLELRRMAVMLSSEITYANAALEEAFSAIAGRLTEPVSGFLIEVKKEMQQGDGGTLGEIFRRQINLQLRTTALKASDLDMLRTLGEQLGYLDVTMQKKTLEYYLEQVNDAWQQAQTEYREKEKLFRCLGISAGVFLVIMLY